MSISGTAVANLLEQAGLSVSAWAESENVSVVAASRWKSGERIVPPAVLLRLQTLADPHPHLRTAAEQGEAVRRRREARRHRRFTYRRALPHGVSKDEARQACEGALRALAEAAR